MNLHLIPGKNPVIKQVEQNWKTLNNTQKQIVDDKQIEGKYSIQEWLKLLTKLSEYGRLNAQGLKLTKPAGIGCGIAALGIIVLPLLVQTLNIPGETVTFVTGLCVVVGGVYLVYLAFLLSYHNKYQDRLLSDNLPLLILPLLELLQEEVADNEQVSIYAYLGERNQYQHTVAGEDAHKPRSTTTTFYQHRLLEITTKFGDGTQMSLEVTDRVRQRVIRKVSQSGKRKMKIKYKTKVICRVGLSFLQKKYALQPSVIGLRVTQKDKYLCFKNKKTVVQAKDHYLPPIHLPLGTIADIYQQVELK